MKEKSPYPEIDKLRAKFDADKALTLREACWILWAELGVCSANYLMFAYWIKQNKVPTDLKMKWQIWKSMYYSFQDGDYLTMSKDLDLRVKMLKYKVPGTFNGRR